MKFKQVQYNKMSPPIVFAQEKLNIPSFAKEAALHIIDIHELFDQNDETEILNILQALDACIDKFELIFIQLSACDVAICINNIKKYLGENNNIIQVLQEQEETNYILSDFRKDCKLKKIKKVILGGVFGSGCVWVAAGKHAKIIHSKILPCGTHPNIRFISAERGFLFDEAIILPEITQGHSELSKGKTKEKLFEPFICFPTTKFFKVDCGEDFIDERTYRTNVEEWEKEDVSAGGNYQIMAFEKPDAFEKLYQDILGALNDDAKQLTLKRKPEAILPNTRKLTKFTEGCSIESSATKLDDGKLTSLPKPTLFSFNQLQMKKKLISKETTPEENRQKLTITNFSG